MTGIRKIGVACALLALGAVAACGSGASSGTLSSRPVTLSWYIGPEPSGSYAAAAKTCSQSSHGEYRVVIHTLPNAADGQREQMLRRLSAHDDGLDILGLDVTWTPEFAEAHWLAPWPAAKARQIKKTSLAAMYRTGRWKGHLYSAPFNTNTQLLWYRKDLVKKPPKTWAQMIAMSKKLAAAGKPHLIEIQGAQYEGYVVWFNTLISSAGGHILSKSSEHVALPKGPTDKALKTIHELAHSVAADPSLSVQMEDQNRIAFESGKAAFEINYPFIYPSAKADVPKIFKNLRWSKYPTVDPSVTSHVTIGGFDLAVSKYSRYRKQAFDAIQCLRKPANQKRDAIKGGLPPVTTSIYHDKAFQKAYPFWKAILTSLQSASVRPKTPAYQSVSIAIASTLSPPGSVSTSDLKPLRTNISNALQSKGLVP